MPTAHPLPDLIDEEEVTAISARVLSRPAIAHDRRQEVFRIESAGLPWDLGAVVYEPRDPADARVGPDGRRVGVLLLHGGSGDFKDVEPISMLMAGTFGYTVLAMTFPGRYHFPDPDGGWPGDTIAGDGTVRTPLWTVDGHIDPLEYDVVTDRSLRDRYGTRTLARAKPGTPFRDRMAAWPLAFEEGMIEACRRFLPAETFSIYGEGHSTGGPFICMLSQRVPNMVGVLAAEHSPFGYICRMRDEWGGMVGKIAGHDRSQAGGSARTDPFDELYIRSWRDLARYAGPERLGREGADALMRLPALMEDVFDGWETARRRPQFKAEYIVTHGIDASLAAAAEVTADRLGLDQEARRALVDRYIGYTRPLEGPDAKPVVPFLFAISAHSRDHSPEVYAEVILPEFRAMEPAPRIHLTRFGAGGHSFWQPAGPELPIGIAPAVVDLFDRALDAGFFMT